MSIRTAKQIRGHFGFPKRQYFSFRIERCVHFPGGGGRVERWAGSINYVGAQPPPLALEAYRN